MDYITHVDSNKYVISLDSLDMGLLHTYTARPDNSATLWTANLNIGTKDYFEFQVQSKTETDAFDDDDSTANDVISRADDNAMSNQILQCTLRINYKQGRTVANKTTNSVNESQSNETTICHICDIDLPAAYLSDHENSLKHKANLKITDTVLSRTTKHILKKSNGYVQKNNSTYFCGPCASEVKLDDKHTHENSETHKKSVSLDENLFELVRLYTNQEHGEKSTSNTIDDENIVKNELDNEIEDNNVVISDSKARLEESEAETIETSSDLSDYFKEYEIMIGSNGRQVIVSQDNFYGFVPIANNHKFCIVCQTIVEDEKVHKKSDTHLNSYIEPFIDKNFIRSLRNSRSHCVICNKIVKNINFHITSDTTHDYLLLLALCFDKNNPQVAEKDPIINVNNEDTHPDTGITNNGLDKGLDMPSPKAKPEITIKPNEFEKIENKTFFCDPCNLKLHVNDRKSHLFGNRHVMHLRSIVPYCMMVGVGCTELLCGVCYVYLEYHEVKAHVASNDHAQKYTNLLANNHVIMKQGYFDCKPCDEVVLNEEELLHIESSTHGTKLLIFEEKQVKLNSTQNTNANKADRNALISNNCKQNGITHSYSDVGKNDPKNPNNYKNKPLKAVEEKADSNYESEYLEVTYVMDATDNENSLLCKVCKVFVPNMDDNINEHVRGKKHDAAFKSIIEANDIETEGDKYFCKLCTVNIKPHNVYNHIHKKEHLALLGNAADPETVEKVEIFNYDTEDEEIDNNSVTSTSSTTDNESVDKYFKLKHHFVESKDKHTLKCRVCSDIVISHTVENVVSHSGSEAHIDGYDNLLSRNLIIRIGDTQFYCSVCDCFIPRTGEVNHAQGNRHTGNFEIYMSNRKQ